MRQWFFSGTFQEVYLFMTVILSCSVFSDEVIQFTAITWIREFVALSGRTMLSFSANILTAILPCVSYDQSKQRILSNSEKCDRFIFYCIVKKHITNYSE